MGLVESASAQQAAVVRRGVDIRVLGKLLDQQRQEGRAALALIAAAQPAPSGGAPEPGKGQSVDVLA